MPLSTSLTVMTASHFGICTAIIISIMKQTDGIIRMEQMITEAGTVAGKARLIMKI